MDEEVLWETAFNSEDLEKNSPKRKCMTLQDFQGGEGEKMIFCTNYSYFDTSTNVLRSLIDFQSLS